MKFIEKNKSRVNQYFFQYVPEKGRKIFHENTPFKKNRVSNYGEILEWLRRILISKL